MRTRSVSCTALPDRDSPYREWRSRVSQPLDSTPAHSGIFIRSSLLSFVERLGGGGVERASALASRWPVAAPAAPKAANRAANTAAIPATPPSPLLPASPLPPPSGGPLSGLGPRHGRCSADGRPHVAGLNRVGKCGGRGGDKIIMHEFGCLSAPGRRWLREPTCCENQWGRGAALLRPLARR